MTECLPVDAYRRGCFFGIYSVNSYMPKRNPPLPLLVDFESRVHLGPTFAARLLGLPYVSYAQYRSGLREFKRTHKLHVKAILMMHAGARENYVKEALDEQH
jgi:hypothetical protein